MNDWISVKERLPEKDGWYFVYAPEYWGNNKIYGLDGLAYSNFKHNYKDHWGIERKMGMISTFPACHPCHSYQVQQAFLQEVRKLPLLSLREDLR